MTTPAGAAGTTKLGDLTVNRLGYGAMRLPGPGVWGPPVDRDEAIRVVRRAVELGVQVIDTAWYYGLDVANEIIAAALRPYPDDLVLVTKLGGARTPDGRWVSGMTPEGLREGCERDLLVLGLEAVPVVHLRWMEPAPIGFGEALDVLLDLQRAGKIQRIGLSTVGLEQVAEALGRTPIASVSNHFGPAYQADTPILERCAAEGIAYLPYFPLGGGRAGRRLCGGEGGGLGRGAARGDPGPGRHRLAAAPLAGGATDPGHRKGRPPGGERGRGVPRAGRGRPRGTGRGLTAVTGRRRVSDRAEHRHRAVAGLRDRVRLRARRFHPHDCLAVPVTRPAYRGPPVVTRVSDIGILNCLKVLFISP